MIARVHFDGQTFLAIIFQFLKPAAFITHRELEKLPEAAFTESEMGVTNVTIQFDTH